MANPRKILPYNVGGEFFVDSTCINCDACRQLAPEIFGEADDYSFVSRQPQDENERRRATRALLACPTGSIGTFGNNLSKIVRSDFPLHLDEEVYYCGFNSADSFGGNSYFVRHPEGNWLIDSPKHLRFLERQIEAAGGLRYIFLSHRDDVADADRYARRFNAQRIIHRYELAAQPDAEIVLDGAEPVSFGLEFLVIPTFGHTRGHCVLLYRKKYLFTGDHLWWSRDRSTLSASRDYCWYSWPQQIESMSRLQEYQFEWVLPGHGERVWLPVSEMNRHLASLSDRMRRGNQAEDW